jgi:K+-transporting ATPase ATPase A chain
MTTNSWIQVGLFLGVLLACVKPLGWYMARVYQGEPCGLDRALGWLERGMYRASLVDAKQEMNWREYAVATLLFNLLGLIAVYLLQRTQAWLPLNPQGFGNVAPDLAFNTAVSFASNTNWQSYSGENSLSYLTQLLALTVQNFVSAATGMAVLVALARGIERRATNLLGNFWVDLTRSTLYILLPLSLLLAMALVSQGVVQNFGPYQTAALLEPQGQTTTQTLPMGPAASQVAIKQLGTNGGGFFGVNSAHPFENPTPLSNFLEVIAILLIPAALCYTYGMLVNDRRQGWAILAAMLVIFVPLLIGVIVAEQQGIPAVAELGVDAAAGNMEGKETRFGVANSAIWAAATTAASNGSVNSMHDSYTPLGGLVPMWLMQLGEVIFGGVGSGLYGMLIFVMVAVFISGLMVGRTPTYLGKKIEAFEMKMAAIVILVPPLVVLIGAAIAVLGPGLPPTNPGAHGFSEILYAFSSAGNNNGSAFAGLTTNTLFYNFALGLAMLLSRYWLIVPVLAIAGSLAQKKQTAASAGTLQTHTPLFVIMTSATVLLVGALTFVPALALGPVVEQLQMQSQHSSRSHLAPRDGQPASSRN